MTTPHTWTADEELQWRTYQLPESLQAYAVHNLKEIESFIRVRGYTVAHGLIDALIQYSSDLRPKLRFANPQSHSVGDALISSLQQRPEPTPEPEPFKGDAAHKLQEIGVQASALPSAADIARAREEARKEREEVVQKARELKHQLEEKAAKDWCEGITCIANPVGKNDRVFLNLLHQVRAKNTDGSINWVRTKTEYQRCLSAYQSVIEQGLRYKV